MAPLHDIPHNRWAFVHVRLLGRHWGRRHGQRPMREDYLSGSSPLNKVLGAVLLSASPFGVEYYVNMHLCMYVYLCSKMAGIFCCHPARFQRS